MKIKEVDGKVGAKGGAVGNASGTPRKSISMDVPGDGGIVKPDMSEDLSTRSAAHSADAWSNIGGGAGTHPYDKSKNFSSSGA